MQITLCGVDFFGILHRHLGVSSCMKLTCSWIQQSYVNLRPSQLNFAFWCTEKLKRMWNLFQIKQSTESNHENKTSKDVVPLPSCVHPKRTWAVSMINRVRKNCGLRFDFVLEVEKKELSVRPLKMIRDYWLLMIVYREKKTLFNLKVLNI